MMEDLLFCFFDNLNHRKTFHAILIRQTLQEHQVVSRITMPFDVSAVIHPDFQPNHAMTLYYCWCNLKNLPNDVQAVITTLQCKR
eukprot:m.130406 g.130406  ORF g.130406 m.130406 type:complete len:85 (-) comp13898_c2_seq10:1077-1331(-)